MVTRASQYVLQQFLPVAAASPLQELAPIYIPCLVAEWILGKQFRKDFGSRNVGAVIMRVSLWTLYE